MLHPDVVEFARMLGELPQRWLGEFALTAAAARDDDLQRAPDPYEAENERLAQLRSIRSAMHELASSNQRLSEGIIGAFLRLSGRDSALELAAASNESFILQLGDIEENLASPERNEAMHALFGEINAELDRLIDQKPSPPPPTRGPKP